MAAGFCNAFNRGLSTMSMVGSPTVKRVNTLEEATKYMRSAMKNGGGARCLVVPNVLKLGNHCGLKPDYESHDLCLCGDGHVNLRDVNAELNGALKALGDAHRAITGDSRARGRVARVSGTPCPKMHVDYLRLRIIATLCGPGTVLHPNKDVIDDTWETNEGDVLFMRGNGGVEGEGGVLHRSPERAPWMSDRVIVQVDDW